MPNIGINVNYRPLRIGYCLRQNDLDGLRQVAILNTYLSGGILNPIIVISDDDEERQIKSKVISARPDILHTFDDSLKPKLKLFGRDYLPAPFEMRDNIISEYEGAYSFHVLDIESVIRNIWETQLKASRKKFSNCILPKWNKDDGLSLLFSLIFGSFDLGYKFKVDYEQLYLKGLKAKPVKIEKDANLPDEVFEKVTPMIFTNHDLEPHYASRYRGEGFIIGRSDNYNDLVSYWNFRSMNPAALFLPIDQLSRFERCLPVIKKIISTIAKSSSRFPRHYDYLLHHSEENEDAAKQIQEKYFSSPKVFRSQYRESPLEAEHTLSYFGELPTQGNVDKNQDGRFTINLQLPDFKYADEKRYYPKRFFVASFRFLTEFEYPHHTLQLPNFCDLNEWYARKVCFQYDRFRVEPAGFGILTDEKKDFMGLRPIYLPELLEKVFERSKITISLSKSGRIARQIIEQMRDIEGCRVFKITGVRNLLSSITPQTEKTRNQCCEIIKDRANNTFSQFEDLYIEAREERKLTPQMAFDFLVKRKVFRPGISIRCNKCELKSWISLTNFSDIVECPLCGNRFSPLIKNPKGIIWEFRRSGLFGEANRQEGAIPVLLTLLQLVRVEHGIRLFTNYSLMSDDFRCELDVIVLSVKIFHQDETPEIVIGECKSPGLREEEASRTISEDIKEKYQFLDKDIENMVKAKILLDGSGFNTHLLFSTTAKKFSEDEIKRFKELCKQHRYVYPILFTANELEPYFDIYKRYKENILPQQHAVCLDHLAQNSKFIYLENRDPQSLLK